MGTGTLNDTRRELGLAPVGSLEQSIRRADRVIFLTSEAFDFPPTTPGPARRVRRGPDPAERTGARRRGRRRGRDDGRPAVLLSLSTTYMQQEDLLQRLVDALGQVDCHALVTTGPGHAVATAGAGAEQRPRGRVGPARRGAAPRRPGDHPRRPRHGDPVAGRRRAGDGRPDQPRPARQRRPRACTTRSGSRSRSDRHRRSSPPRSGALSPTTRSTPTPAAMAERLAPDIGAPKAVAALEELAAGNGGRLREPNGQRLHRDADVDRGA